MDSAVKNQWWQKKTVWGAALVVVAGGLSLLPALEPMKEVLKAVETLGLTLAGYGAVEVARSNTSATKRRAEQTDAVVDRNLDDPKVTTS